MPRVGSSEVITGSMFCGKTDEMIRRLRREKIALRKIQVFKPKIDKRYSEDKAASHSGSTFPALVVENISEIREKLEIDTNIVAIEEAQFFDEKDERGIYKIVDLVNEMAAMGKRVIVVGLDTDFRGEPFGPMPALTAQAEIVDKLNAICMVCGGDASRTQRIVNGQPANYNDEQIVVGAAETYEARCRKHHEVLRSPRIK